MSETVILRVKSGRAIKAIDSALGRHPQYLYTWAAGGEFCEVTAEEAAKVKGVRGVTVARVDRAKLRKCWPMVEREQR